MSTVLNVIWLLATVLFTAVVFVQVLRKPPAEYMRAGWPLRDLWLGARLRHFALAMAFLAAGVAVFVAVGEGTGAQRDAYVPALLLGGCAMVAVGGSMLAYSIALYWGASATEPDGF